MNPREKLLLVWAFLATALLLASGIALAQMLMPRTANAAKLVDATEMKIHETVLYECNRNSFSCAPVTFPRGAQVRPHQEFVWLWVTRNTATEWRAFSNVSTHLGCFVMWQPVTNRFEDPCGGAKWQRDGAYLEGPAPRDLDYFPVRVENGEVWIDFQLIRGNEHN